MKRWGSSSLAVLDQQATDAGSIPGKGFSSESQLSVQTLSHVSIHLCVRSRVLTSVRMLKIHGPCQSLVDYRQTKTPSMHGRLGNMALESQLASSDKSNPNFPWEKSQWDNTVVTSFLNQ